ncbi:hypothetical protein TNCV_1637811 [Trichonephila clavipes]|nr:hypothetical protein TNCV_1637811 [Trichonephila clavipes]
MDRTGLVPWEFLCSPNEKFGCAEIGRLKWRLSGVYTIGQNPQPKDWQPNSIPLDKNDHPCPKAVTGLRGYCYNTVDGTMIVLKVAFFIIHPGSGAYPMGQNSRPKDSQPNNIPLDKSDHPCPEAVAGLRGYRYTLIMY